VQWHTHMHMALVGHLHRRLAKVDHTHHHYTWCQQVVKVHQPLTGRAYLGTLKSLGRLQPSKPKQHRLFTVNR